MSNLTPNQKYDLVLASVLAILLPVLWGLFCAWLNIPLIISAPLSVLVGVGFGCLIYTTLIRSL